MISYYELLGMIKEGKAPNKIKAHLNSQPKIYVREDDLDDTFSYYGLEEGEKEDSDYHYYLAECFLESSMFDENIEILDEKKIEKLTLHPDDWTLPTQCDLVLANKIDEIIDYLESKEEKK